MHNPPVGRLSEGLRVHELAKELGVRSCRVLGLLQTLGVYVKTASSTISPADAQRIREHFASEPVTASSGVAGPVRRMNNNPFAKPSATRRPVSGGDDPFAKARPPLQSEVPDPFTLAVSRLGRPARPSRPAPGRARSPLTGTAAEIMRRWPGQLQPENARAWASSWADQWMDPREITEWWDAGMAWSDVSLVALLKSLDMTPATLAKKVGNRTVLQLLRSGLRPQNIALRLRGRDH